MAYTSMTVNTARNLSEYDLTRITFHGDMKTEEICSRGKELAKVEKDAGQIIATQSTQIELHVAYDLKLRELNTLLQKAIRLAKAADSDYIEVNTKAHKEIEELTSKLKDAEARYQAHRVNASELRTVKEELAQANVKLARLAKKKKKSARLGKSMK